MFDIKYVRRANVTGVLNISQLHYLGMIITHYLDKTNYSKQHLISENGQDVGIKSLIETEFQVSGGANPASNNRRYLAV